LKIKSGLLGHLGGSNYLITHKKTRKLIPINDTAGWCIYPQIFKVFWQICFQNLYLLICFNPQKEKTKCKLRRHSCIIKISRRRNLLTNEGTHRRNKDVAHPPTHTLSMLSVDYLHNRTTWKIELLSTKVIKSFLSKLSYNLKLNIQELKINNELRVCLP
jgi:hypothetical protein